ncbi:MAG: hypothetical protein Q8936_06440 [Bacillota bacterium]|nr:hypothetical protein [Bacillota bacterium]
MPILRDIFFDVPYKPNKNVLTELVGKSEDECNKITTADYQKNCKERNFKFRLQTRCISSLYVYHLGKFKNDKCWRIIIECVPNIDRGPGAFGGFYHVQVKLDIDSFLKLSDIDKKRKTLELIKNAITEIVEIERWDKGIFENAYNQVISENYVNKRIWKKQKSSPGRQYIAKVLVEHDLYKSEISIVITDKNGAIVKQEKVATDLPDEWAYTKYLGELKWISNTEISLISKSDEYEFTVSLD